MRKVINVEFLVLMFCLCACSVYNLELYQGNGGIEQARLNVITDFAYTYKTPKYNLKQRKGKPYNVFWVFDKKLNGDVHVFSIIPENDDCITISINDSLGKVPISYFPNRFKMRNDKLFLWKDSITPLKEDIVNIVNEFGLLDSIDVKRELGLLPYDFEDTRMVIIDDKLKGVDYFVCLNNVEIYKKIFTNKSFKFYKNPKLKCNP